MLETIQTKHAELEALCHKYDVTELALFGSALTAAFSTQSDLDFLVTFQDMTPVQRAEAFFGLWFGLEDLFERNVDLVVRDAIQNPYFKQEVIKTSKGLYAA
jgi:uncharacterized protein